MFEKIQTAICQMRTVKPLILNITNYVTMDFIANGLLSLGASPIMCHSKHEIDELLTAVQAVTINVGTLDHEFIFLCQSVCHAANQLGIPIVLDPVGAGASRYRTETCLALIHDFDIAIIRGNVSEIMALAGLSQKTKGVDSGNDSSFLLESAKSLSKNINATLVVSGQRDFIVDHDRVAQFDRGSALMPAVTGTGCLLTAVTAAFHAINKDRFESAQVATLFYAICGEIAAKNAAGPGTFKTHFLDSLHGTLSRGQYEKH